MLKKTELRLRENINYVQIKSRSLDELKVILYGTSQCVTQFADKNANIYCQWKLSMNLFNTCTHIQALKFSFSGWWFDAAGVNKFLQYASFRFEIGRQLHSGVRNNPLEILRKLLELEFFFRGEDKKRSHSVILCKKFGKRLEHFARCYFKRENEFQGYILRFKVI